MPVWRITHHDDAYTNDDKQMIAQAITKLYESILPKFYVNVFFEALPAASFYIGGEPADDFVRFRVDHIARSIKDDVTERRRFLDAVSAVLHPFVAGRGLRWEFNVDETPFELWTINGLYPPPQHSEAETRWRQENRATPYDTPTV